MGANLATSPLLQVLYRKKPSRKPIWFMRQAGRYLPEYRALRAQHSMLEAIRTPNVAAEITLQPMRRFDLDAAIIFADILNPLIGLGFSLDFIEKEGPKIFNPITKPQDVENLKSSNPKVDVAYTLEAIQMVCAELKSSGVPLLGFAGAPFTLSTYVLEGKTAHSLSHVKDFIARHPDSWKKLQEKFSAFLVEYLVAQVEAGVSAVQIFDSWAGYLSPYQYAAWVYPHLHNLITSLRNRISVPILYFSTGTSGVYDQIRNLPADAFSVDWRMKLSDVTKIFGSDVPIQGNLDPELMGCDQNLLLNEVRAVLEDARSVEHHIFNLGHGILPHTPPENLKAVIDLVHAAPV